MGHPWYCVLSQYNIVTSSVARLSDCLFAGENMEKNYVPDIAENAPGELYTAPDTVKVNDLVSMSTTLFQGQGPRPIARIIGTKMYDLHC